MGKRRMFQSEGYPKPVEIVHYECGPPAFHQCEDCRRASVSEAPPIAEGDGLKRVVCAFGQDPLREGRCVLQVPFSSPSLVGLDIGMGP